MSWSLRRFQRLPFLFQSSRSLASKNKTHYETLGLSHEASSKEIKDSYIALSKVHHPDSPEGSAEQFRFISEAYEILSNEGSKRDYDASLPKKKSGRERGFPQGRRHDPAPVHRSIKVDMSPERMENAWNLYKDRWSREEDRLRDLEKKKKEFRQTLDDIRANMHNMTPEDKELFLEGLRQFRRPEHFQQFRRSDKSTTEASKNSDPSDNKEEIVYETFYYPRRFSRRFEATTQEMQDKYEKMKAIYETSEFLGENYAGKTNNHKTVSVKYDIDQKGEVFRISQLTVKIIFGVFFVFFIINITYKNDIRKTNRFFLIEEEKKRQDT